MHLDHVGIATTDAASTAELFADLFDAPIAHRETFDGNRVVFVDLGQAGDGGHPTEAGESDEPTDPSGPYLETLAPTGDEGPIARFLDREGPGIHHVALAVPDAARALAHAESLGIDLVDDAPRPGAWGHRVAFLHPSDTGGVLVEFVEK